MSVPAENVPSVSKKKLPADIQATIDSAKRIEQGILDARKPAESESGVDEPTETAESPEGGEAGEQSVQRPTGEVAEEEGASPQGEDPRPVEPPPTVIADDYEQKWRSLDGIVSQRDRRIAELEAQLDVATQSQQERASRLESAPEGLSAQDVENYGQEMVDFAQRAARDAVRGEIDALRSENAQLKQQLAGQAATTQASAHEVFLSNMDAQFPQWRSMNENPAFLAGLEGPDLLRGQQRRALLNDAVGQRNTVRTIALFKSYLSEKEAVNGMVNPQPASPTPSDAPPEPARPGRVPLEQMAAPGVGSGSGTDGNSDGGVQTVTQDEITRFYDDVRKGRYKMYPDRYAAMEQKIQAAIRAGKVA